MSMRLSSASLRLIRSCSAKQPLLRCLRNPSTRPFSSSRICAEPVKLYAKTHEWILIQDDKTGIVGISDYAQNLLGDVVYVELPPIDAYVEAQKEMGAVESVKSASDIYAPMTGQVIEVNEKLTAKPSLINKSPEDEGWICKIALGDETEQAGLMGPEAYATFLVTEDHGDDHK